MGLRHAVITSVDRDDLPDKGASAFVGVVRQIRKQAPGCKIELLTPDFQGQEMPLAKVIAERPDVFNHNVEVVPRLYPVARRGSTFLRSARVLRNAKAMGGDEVTTKCGLMVGLGESFEEMVETFGILREHDVQVLTVGQYLRPSDRHLPVVRYWHPDEFAALEQAAYDLGFDHIAAGPLVRSSYHADEHVPQDRPGRRAARRVRPDPLPRGPRLGRPPVIPLKDSIPTARAAWVTIVLIAINVVVYFVAAAGRDPRWAEPVVGRRLRRDPLRADAPRRPLRRAGADHRVRTRASPPPGRDLGHRLHLDVHARLDPAPRGGNMLFLWIFGNNVEDSMGRLRFVVFYLLGGSPRSRSRCSSSPAPPCRRSAPRGRSRRCSAATSSASRAPA